VAHHAFVHHVLLPPLVVVALAFSCGQHRHPPPRLLTKQYINILHTWYTHKAMAICMTQHI
jgi:hypothetical protein